MNDNKGRKIGYGVSLFNEIKVTSISVDNWMQKMRFICEKGGSVDAVECTIEFAIDCGILNLNPLVKMFPQPPKTSDKP